MSTACRERGGHWPQKPSADPDGWLEPVDGLRAFDGCSPERRRLTSNPSLVGHEPALFFFPGADHDFLTDAKGGFRGKLVESQERFHTGAILAAETEKRVSRDDGMITRRFCPGRVAARDTKKHNAHSPHVRGGCPHASSRDREREMGVSVRMAGCCHSRGGGGWWWWGVGSGGWWWPPASHPAPTHPCSRSGQSTQHDKTGRHCAPSPCPTPMGGGGEPTMHKEIAKNNPRAKK